MVQGKPCWTPLDITGYNGEGRGGGLGGGLGGGMLSKHTALPGVTAVVEVPCPEESL